MDSICGSIVSLNGSNRFWIVNSKMIYENPAGSPPNPEHASFMIQLNEHCPSYRLFSISNKHLMFGIDARTNSFNERQSVLRDISEAIPGCTWNEGMDTILYKNKEIGCKKFTNEKAVELTEKLNGYISHLNTSLSMDCREKNSGEESEIVFTNMINKWFLGHPIAADHEMFILVTDFRGNLLHITELKECDHIGHDKKIADIVVKTNSKEVYISLKNGNAEEWTSSSQILNGPEVEFFLESALKKGLIVEKGIHKFQRGGDSPDCVDADFADNISGIATAMSEELMKKVLFGVEGNKCDGIIIQTFTDGYQFNSTIVHKVDGTDQCCGMLAVQRLVFDTKDVIETRYEPRLFIRRKADAKVTIGEKTYYGIALCAAFKSRSVSGDGKLIVELEPWKSKDAAAI